MDGPVCIPYRWFRLTGIAKKGIICEVRKGRGSGSVPIFEKEDLPMKTDRLVNMIFLLLKRKRISARELADSYQCSVRTIYRDIATLEQAGVPILSYRGAEGGFELIEGYRIDKPFLSSQEASIILGLLHGIKDVVDDVEIESISSKMDGADAAFSNLYFDMKGWWMSDDLRTKVNQINQCITRHQQVFMEYFNSYHHSSKRTVYPIKIVVKGSQWYLHAYCTLKNDYRLFKINRIKSLQLLDEFFNPKQYQALPKQNNNWAGRAESPIILKFDINIYSTYKDFFLEEQITQYNQDHFIVKVHYPIDNWVKGLILSFGTMVEVIEPSSLREEIKKIAQEVAGIYDIT